MTGGWTSPGLKRLRVLALDALLWCLLGALLAAGFANKDAIGKLYPSFSLRFDTPVTGQAAYGARAYSIEHREDETFWPTFWHQRRASFSSEFFTVEADCIAYSGDIALVWPAQILSGAAPGVTDGEGCAVSAALAWRLWGDIDAAGRVLEVDGSERQVRAVFKGNMELALLPYRDEDRRQIWSAAELSGGPSAVTDEDILAYCAASGLGKPDAILRGAGPSFLAGAMTGLPLAILAVYGIALAAGLIRKRPIARKLLPFLLLLGLAAAMPALLDMVPPWLIPSRWSDFSFWVSLVQKGEAGLRESLSLTPRLRDIDGQTRLILQSGIAIASACLALLVCFRWHLLGRDSQPGRPESFPTKAG